MRYRVKKIRSKIMAKNLAKSEGVDQTGFRLVFNCGPDAGQAVDHLHLHLLSSDATGV